MATLILRDTYIELEQEMESINKLRADTASQIQEAPSFSIGDMQTGQYLGAVICLIDCF